MVTKHTSVFLHNFIIYIIDLQLCFIVLPHFSSKTHSKPHTSKEVNTNPEDNLQLSLQTFVLGSDYRFSVMAAFTEEDDELMSEFCHINHNATNPLETQSSYIYPRLLWAAGHILRHLCLVYLPAKCLYCTTFFH